MAGKKAAFTHNPLAVPSSPIHALASAFQSYLFFPDPSPLYATIGAFAANLMQGNSVWLMLVGPPACGKTALLESLLQIPKVYPLSNVKGPSALLSGVARKDKARDAHGGLLRKIGDRGAIVIKDFTSILSMPHDPLMETMGALREVYDGRWSRDIGSEGGRTLDWSGKIAILAGCTQVIDRHHEVISDMGERWVFFRYPDSDGFGECRTALHVKNPERAREEMQEIVAAFFSALDLDFEGDQPKRDWETGEWTRIVSMAMIAARCRSTITRNRYTREVEDVAQAEFPTRLCAALGQLYLGMELVGLEAEERWRVLGRIALDCMPQIRRRTVEMIRHREDAGVDSTLDEIQMELKCSQNTTRRVVEDLEIHGVVRKVVGLKKWRLTEWAREEIRQGWGRGNGKRMGVF